MATLASSRLVSLDVFRGVTMAAMVIVNNPGDWGNVYAPLLHAPWHGLTPTDLIFPFFLFIVGVSITLATRSAASIATIVRRAALIFGLGMLLALYPRFDFATVRIPGVLQRIAVCYLAVALFHRALAGQSFGKQFQWTVGLAITLLIGYWLVMRHDLSADGNLGAVIDRSVFGNHLWRQSRTWDPEGLLSTVPAIATTLSGLGMGYLLRADMPRRSALDTAFAIGAGSVLVGVIWAYTFPINKSLWTSSYVLVTSGLAAIVLAALERTLMRYEHTPRVARPFVALGRNALLLFVLSGFLAKTLGLMTTDNHVYRTWFVPFMSPKNASLLWAMAHLLLLFALLWWLDRRRWYFRV